MTIDPSAGRRIFGGDAENYDAARPEYPERVYEMLVEMCGLRAGTPTFDVGAGTGQATFRLISLGASPLVAIEPDLRMATVLGRRAQSLPPERRPGIIVEPFEDVDLPDGVFSLGVAATSFHWLDQRAALRQVARLLRPGGWWAMWWTTFGNTEGVDAFHEATRHLFAGGNASPSHASGAPVPFAQARDDRMADLRETGSFERITTETIPWTLTTPTAELVRLYRTFSPVAHRPEADRECLLAGLGRVADEQFGGVVHRRVSTTVYLARRI